MLSAITKLNTAAAVRERCGMVRDWVADGRSSHFALDETRLAAVAAYVADVTRESYPGLNIPAHSRWRHFAAGGVDRWNTLVTRIHEDAVERARIAADLATVSVLLDAGAGDRWRYRERASGVSFARSEGLAVASFDMFRAGAFSSDPDRPWRVDAAALARIDAATLARHFQVDAENPLIGLEQRSTLLRRLGKALVERPDLFGAAPARPGNLIDYFFATAGERRVSAARLLTTLLDGLSSIWPSALMAEGRPIGDAGRHPAVCTGDGTDGIVPFHKLSQWLAYSLFAPLEAAALAIERPGELTALAEYRNGGLLIDLGAIRPRAAIDPLLRHDVASELIVEWRALTVALMDPLVDLVRARLGLDASFAMPQLLQGGTWSAGRKIARALRPPDGAPPIAVAADGTVF
ncbi:MAG TPA: DUF1688 family protein [Xanthobacteraceae bacterium]|nr:DUF1688 family protein [Xanthobacteraceae bacterium]